MSHLKEKLQHAHTIFKETPIPTIPKEVIELRNKFANSEFPDLNELAEIIGQNPTLAGEVVMVANKPYCLGNRLTEVQSIRDAVDVIGLTRLKNMVMSMGFKMQMDSMALAEVVHFMLAVASVAAEVAQDIEDISADEAYTAGLFHNAGTLLMASHFDDYDKVFMNGLKYGYRAPMLEDNHYGVNHTIAGLIIAQKWELDRRFTQVMFMHHQHKLDKISDSKTRTLIAIVQMASSIVIQSEYTDYSGDEVELLLQNAMNELMVKDDMVEEFAKAMDD